MNPRTALFLCALVLSVARPTPSLALPFEDRSVELIEYGRLKANQIQDRCDLLTGSLQQNLPLNGLALHASSAGVKATVPINFSVRISDGWNLQLKPLVGATLGFSNQRLLRASASMQLGINRLLRAEGRIAPALIFSASSNLLTGRHDPFGSGEGKYGARLVAAKQVGHLELFANTAYSFSSHFSGSRIARIFQRLKVSVGGQHRVRNQHEFLAALTGKHTSKLRRLEADVDPLHQQEFVFSGTIRGGTYLRPNVLAHLGMGYDTRGAIRFNPGISAQF